jgi:predicted O-methyltransferase YrrM
MTTALEYDCLAKALVIDGWMAPDELSWLAANAADKVVLELGSFKGRSATAMAGTAIKVYCVDDFQGSPEHAHWFKNLHPRKCFMKNMAELMEDDKVQLFEGRFADVVRGFPFSLVDMVFIDGDHKEASVREDIALALPLLRKGGLLCGHDYGEPNHPGVKVAVDDALKGEAKLACCTIWEWEKT